MNAMLTAMVREPWSFCETPSPYDAQAPPEKTRVAVFASFMGGYHVLQELLSGSLASRVKVIGVATDDPNQLFTHASVRL